MDLAELAQAITADRNLCRRVIKAAMQECNDWPRLTIEQAIVLLGRERLAAQLLRIPNINRVARWSASCAPQPLQEEAE